jgi:hypothetical protein
MPKYRSKHTVRAKRIWSADQHHAVDPIPSKFNDYIPVKKGAIGYISRECDSGIFVMPGYYIVEDGKDIYPCSPKEFERNFEKVED